MGVRYQRGKQAPLGIGGPWGEPGNPGEQAKSTRGAEGIGEEEGRRHQGEGPAGLAESVEGVGGQGQAVSMSWLGSGGFGSQGGLLGLQRIWGMERSLPHILGPGAIFSSPPSTPRLTPPYPPR